MSSPRNELPDPREASFPEAVAQWRLQLRTEVKAASSLPTSVFHSRDAMLEAMLAETAETMLASLPPEPAAAAGGDNDGEQRIEHVSRDEIAALPRHLAAGPNTPLDVDDHRAAESLAVLADACLTGDATSAPIAADLLRAQFGIAPDQALAAATAQVQHVLRQTLRGAPGAEVASAQLCQRIATALAASRAASPTPSPDRGARA
jgi:hypothetical protein